MEGTMSATKYRMKEKAGVLYDANDLEVSLRPRESSPAWLQLVESQTIDRIFSAVSYQQHRELPPYGRSLKHRTTSVLPERKRESKVTRFHNTRVEYMSRTTGRPLHSNRPDDAVSVYMRKQVQLNDGQPVGGPKNKRIFSGHDPCRNPAVTPSQAANKLYAAIHRSKTSSLKQPRHLRRKPGAGGGGGSKTRPGTAAKSAGTNVSIAASQVLAESGHTTRPLSAPSQGPPQGHRGNNFDGSRTQGFFSPLGEPKYAHHKTGERLAASMMDEVPPSATEEEKQLLASIGVRPTSAPPPEQKSKADLASQLQKDAAGYVNGIVRVPEQRFAYARATCAEWATIAKTEHHDDGGAAIHVVLEPTDYDQFLKHLQDSTEGDFQFLAAVTSELYSGADMTQEYKSDNIFEEEKKEVMSAADAVRRTMNAAKAREETQARMDKGLLDATSINNTPLMYALLVSGSDVYGKTMRANPNVTRPSDGMTPLCIAAARGHDKAVRLLLEHGADKERRNNKGKSPFMLARAASKRAGEMVAHGAIGAALKLKNANEAMAMLESRSILKSAKDGDLKRVKFLVTQAGVDPTTPNQYGMTPLHFACINKDLKMAVMLVKAGADPLFKNNVNQSPLDIAEDTPGMGALVQSLKKHAHFQQLAAAKRRKRAKALQAVASVGMAAEMRQAFRGTAAAEEVYKKYKRSDATPYSKPPPPKRRGMKDGGARYMKTASHTSAANAKSVRFDGSLHYPHQSDAATGSKSRRQRAYNASVAASGSSGRRMPKPNAAGFDTQFRYKYGNVA